MYYFFSVAIPLGKVHNCRKRAGHQIGPGKPDNAYRAAKICGRMCNDIGSQKSLFTFKDVLGDCLCQEQVDSIDECVTSSEGINLYKYLGEIARKIFFIEAIIVLIIVQTNCYCIHYYETYITWINAYDIFNLYVNKITSKIPF